jgi:hypothetical protein
MPTWRETVIHVTHGDFRKPYYIDLLVDDGVIYELKAAERLVPVHDRQLIHYLLLTGQNHGKIVNFRSTSVEAKFVSTNLTLADRRDFTLFCQDFVETDHLAAKMNAILSNLLEDWGAYLELTLYREAVLHFLGGEEELASPVELRDGGRVMGRQRMHLLSPTTALYLSAASKHPAGHEKHLRRLLHHTPLHAIQWINLAGRNATLKTLSRD